MNFDEISKTLDALGKVVAARGGDSSALAATQALLRAQKALKQADFLTAAKKAVKDGLRLARATEVRAGAAVEAMEDVASILKASGGDAKTLKALSELKSFFRTNSAQSLDALAEGLKAQRGKPSSAAKPAPRAKPASSAKPAARAAAKPAAKIAAQSASKTATKTASKPVSKTQNSRKR